MSGRARGHASADAAAVDDDYGFAALGELIGSRDAGNARADDGDIAFMDAIEHLRLWCNFGIHPE